MQGVGDEVSELGLAGHRPKEGHWHSRCGTTGSPVSWGCWDTGLIPGLAQWVKDLALLKLQFRSQLQLRFRSQLQLRSDPWPGSSICRRAAKKKNNNNNKVMSLPTSFLPFNTFISCVRTKCQALCWLCPHLLTEVRMFTLVCPATLSIGINKSQSHNYMIKKQTTLGFII